MGITLNGTTPQNTYQSLIKLGDNGTIDGTLQRLSDGDGNDLPLLISSASVNNTGAGDIITNTAFGTDALIGNTTGFSNTALGVSALSNNTTGADNSALGGNALLVNTTGSSNSAVGVGALFDNTTGSFNSAMGYKALQFNTTGGGNSAMGVGALRNNTTGILNSAVGQNALYSNTTGSSNSAMGENALLGNTTGSNNTAIGENAGTFIADGANGNETGIQNVFIGTDTKANADGDTNEIVIGYNAIGNGTNSVVLGNDDIASTELKGDVTISSYTEGALSTTNTGLIQLEPTFKNLSFGESYANLKTEDYLTNGFTVNPTDVGYQYAKLIQSDLLNKSSILLIPQATKESVLGVNRGADLDVVRATTATRVNSDGLIETVAINVPRIDYTGGGCGKLLLEPQRTNLLSYSEQFDNAAWGVFDATISANAAVSPDGLTSGDKFIGNAGTFNPLISRNTTGVTAAAAHTLSVFAKKSGYNFIYLQEASVGNGRAWFDLENGTLGTKQGDITSSKITDYGNGWYRCEMTFNQSGTQNRTRFGVSNADNVTTFVNDGTSGIFIWGAQVEEASYATSYIPTLAAAVTRNADQVSKTGISSLIGQTEGTLFLELAALISGGANRIISISDGTSANKLEINFDPVIDRVTIAFTANSVNQYVVAPILNEDNFNKIAIKYKANDFACYFNGVKVNSQLSGNTSISSPFDRINFANPAGGFNFQGKVNQLLIFPTALSDADAIALTA